MSPAAGATPTIGDLRAEADRLAGLRADAVRAAADQAALADAAASAARGAAALADAEGHARAQHDLARARQIRQETLTSLARYDEQVASLVAQLPGDPCDLESDVPLALLPVRLETRYANKGAILRVRIFPDDIHIDRLDRGVGPNERTAGTAFWTAVTADPAAKDKAWRALCQTVHPNRAAWVAAALRPPAPGVVPADIPPRLQQPPVARALPDRFVVTVIQNGGVSRAVGNPVPAELVVGLPPDSDPAQLIKNGEIRLGPGMEWMVDPAEAKRVGMLVDVPLAVPGGGAEHVFVVGVRASLDPAAGAAELTRLLEAHRYVTGAAFVRPGTPTNNTETDRAAWTRIPNPTPPPTGLAATPDPQSSAGVLATALGISPLLLSELPYGDGRDQPLAAAAQTSLWQPTWGKFIERLMAITARGANIDDTARQAWRDFWQDHVRGRGPLPLLQVGDQPYGVLPAAAVHGHWHGDESDRFEASLLNVLRRARPLVHAGLVNVPTVSGAQALDDTLLEILGSAPHLLGVRVRSVASEASSVLMAPLLGLATTNDRVQFLLDDVLWAHMGVTATAMKSAYGADTRPLGLPLVSDDKDPSHSDKAFVAALEGKKPRVVRSILQALLELAAGAEADEVVKASPPHLLERLTMVSVRALGAADLGKGLQGLVSSAVAGKADPAHLQLAAQQIGQQFGVAGLSKLAVEQPVPGLRTSLAEASSSALGDLTALGAWLHATAGQSRFFAAADVLVSAPPDDRRIAVAETLDCASHRFDAWVSAIPTARLAQIRSRRDQTPGVLLGAYGWVENLAPEAATTRAGGFIHAPSLSHAATAGVLRSGYLTHNPDAGGSGALSVDLSSARVRRAVAVLDGVRQGQPLGALVGYAIERSLHEAGLDVYTLSLRNLAPIVALQLTDRADAVPEQAKESITANNVLDGLKLLARPRAAIRAALNAKPVDNPYLNQPGIPPWKGPTDGQWAVITAALDAAADNYAAVSDVLLAEAVHQLVQGNTARASAAMDAAAGGDAAPVEPEVLRTPTRAAALTQRVLILLPDTPPGSTGWSAATPRALAEPALAAWAESRLGPASNVVIAVAADGTRTTLDAAGLSALDVVYDSVNPDTLARRIRGAVAAAGPWPLPSQRLATWPAGLIAVGELATMAAALLRVVGSSQPLRPASLARPNDTPPARTLDPSGLLARLTPVVALLQAAVGALSAALAAVPPVGSTVATAVDGLRPFGISLPAGGALVAEATLAEGQRRLADALVARAALAAPPVVPPLPGTVPDPAAAALAATDRAQAVADALFGTGFPVLATVVPGPGPGPTDLYGATFDALVPGPGRAQVRRWLRDEATVRPAVARYAETLLFADALNGVDAGPRLAVAQLAATGTAGTASWLGTALAAGAASPDQPVTSLVIEVPVGYTAGVEVAGLVVDEWVEQIPRRDAAGATTVTTGVAINANAPNTRPPQAVLLAISPDDSRWSADGLMAVLIETLELAKLRGVTLERSALIGRILPAIQEQSWYLQGDQPALDLEVLVTELSTAKDMLAYVKEAGT